MGTRGQGRQVTTAGVRKAVVAFVVLVLGWCLLCGAWSMDSSDSSPVQASTADSNGFQVEPAMTPETLADEPIVPLVCGVNLDCSDVHTKQAPAGRKSSKSSPTVTRRHTSSSQGSSDSITTKTATGSTTVTTRTNKAGKTTVSTSTTTTVSR
jgi:hypothetical protein